MSGKKEEPKQSRRRRAFYDMCRDLGLEPGEMLVKVHLAGTQKAMEYLEFARRGAGHSDFPGMPAHQLMSVAIKQLASCMENEKFIIDRAYGRPSSIEMSGPNGGPIPFERVERVIVDVAEGDGDADD